MATDDFASESVAMITFFNDLTLKVQALKREMASLADQSGVGFKKVNDESEKFGTRMSHHVHVVKQMKEETGGLSKNLLGPLGIAAGLIATVKALDEFAVGELRLRNFATNVGLSVDAAQKLKLQLQASGLEAGEAAQQISNITSKLDSMKTFLTASPLYKSLAASDPVLAGQILQAEKLGDRLRSIQLIREAYERAGPRQRLYFEQQFGTTAAGMEALGANTQGLIQPWIRGTEEARKYHIQMLNIKTTFDNVWGSLADTFITEINKMIGGVDQLDAKAKSFTENFKKYMEENVGPAIQRELGTIHDIQKFFEGRQFEPGKGPPLALTPEEFLKRQQQDKNFNPWEWLKKQMGFGEEDETLPKGASPIAFHGSDLLDTEKEGTIYLRDMRDLMQKWDASREHPGPGAAPGVSGAGMLFRPGVRAPSAGGSGGRGFRGGPGGDEGTDVGTIPGGSGAPNAAIAEQRSALIAEINGNPALKEKVYSMLQSEEGGLAGRTATMEALLNRTLMIRKYDPTYTVEKELNSGFYGPINRGELRQTVGRSRQISAAAFNTAAAGSMVAQGRTDQGMVGDPNWRGPGRVNVPGTGGIFNFWQGTRRGHYFSHGESQRFADEEQRLAEEGRRRMDKKLSGDLGGASITVDFTGMPRGVKTNAELIGMTNEGIFKMLNINRKPQAPIAGSDVQDYNRFSFE